MVFAGLQQVAEMASSRACPGSFERYGIAMNPDQAELSGAQALPPARLGIAITGHRVGNAAFDTNLGAIQTALSEICSTIEQVVSSHEHTAPVRLNALFANGSDLLAVDEAFARGWEIVAPLPFGLRLNTAINAHPRSAAEARALIAGDASGEPVASAYAARVEALANGATRFELAEQDEQVAALFLATLDNPADDMAARAFSAVASERAAMAGKVMIEQSDLLIAIWDGVTPGALGGTRHTMAAALNEGVPVLWIDAATPGRVRLLLVPEALQINALTEPDIAGLIETLIAPDSSDQHARAIRYQIEQLERKLAALRAELDSAEAQAEGPPEMASSQPPASRPSTLGEDAPPLGFLPDVRAPDAQGLIARLRQRQTGTLGTNFAGVLPTRIR